MKKILSILITLLLLFSCNVQQDEPPVTKDGWLIMVYVSGTGTLEKESIYNIAAMESGYSSLPDDHKNRTDIVVLHDRGPGYSSIDGDWTGTRLYEINPSGNKIYQISSPAIESVSGWRESSTQEEKMGSKETLNQFIKWAKSTYKNREKHALIIWNHGGGLSSQSLLEPLSNSRAVSWDAEDNGSGLDEALYVNEIQEVLNSNYTSTNKLNILGFDACLMGMVEIAYEFRDVADYMVASPAVELGGWRYKEFISTLTPETTPENLSKNIVASYRYFSNGYYPGNTMSAIDLSHITSLKDSISNLATKTKEYNNKTAIVDIRNNGVHFFNSSIINDEIMFPYIDLGEFATALESISELSIEAKSVNDNLKKVIISAYGGTTKPYYGENISRGLSIFFSGGTEDYKRQWWYTGSDTGTYGNIDFCINSDGTSSPWKDLMDSYFK